MHKSLFKKYLLITMSIVLASYVVLGSVMMLFFSRYWRSEKQSLLAQSASSIADITKSYTYYDSATDSYLINGEDLSSMLLPIAKNIDADIFITDLKGNRLMGAYSNSGLSDVKQQVNQEDVSKAANGMYEFNSTFDGVYKMKYYAVGIPCTIIDKNGQSTVAGVVFATTTSSSIMAYQAATFQMFLIAAVATLILTFFVVWVFTYNLVKPLRQMASAAKAFGSGDFSSRVPIESMDEIGELSLAFNNMANSLSNSEGMRRSFIANVSHELKTPMTTIAGFIDGILDGTIPPEKQPQYLKIVSDEVKRLSRLVKSMLDLSRIDSGEMKLNPVRFDMTDTVCSTLLTFEQLINDKNIEIQGLEETAPLMINGDQDLLHQVVYNLIENAVKFTGDGGYIRFGLSDSVDRACVSIENSGLGIPKDEQAMIFDRFYKTDKSRSRDKNGMGLGLYLVKTIIQLHGGDISVSSVENQYCRFDFYIPKQTEEEAPKQLKAAVIPLTGKAEDENDIQDVK